MKYRGGGAIPECPSTRDAAFGGDRPEDALVGHDAIRGEPRGAGRKALSKASYQDGQAHAYASNIPTLGGIATGTYPTPGGPNTASGAGATYLSLNISGNDAANFMTGQFVTPKVACDTDAAPPAHSCGTQ